MEKPHRLFCAPFRHATWQKLNGSKPSVQVSWYADANRQKSVFSEWPDKYFKRAAIVIRERPSFQTYAEI